MSRKRMQPVMILPKGLMAESDIEALRANQICVVECEKPEEVRSRMPSSNEPYIRRELRDIPAGRLTELLERKQTLQMRLRELRVELEKVNRVIATIVEARE